MAKVRVHELAKQIGMSSKDLLKRLAEMGEFPKSASSTLEAPVVRRVLSDFPDHAPLLRRDMRPGSNPFASTYSPPLRPSRSSGRTSAEEEAADFFGIPVSQVPRSRGSRRRTQFDEEQRRVDAWLKEFIEPAEKRKWLAAGVFEEELPMVLEWKRCGMTVEDLEVTFKHGATALQHLRGYRDKYTVEQIAMATRKRKEVA